MFFLDRFRKFYDPKIFKFYKPNGLLTAVDCLLSTILVLFVVAALSITLHFVNLYFGPYQIFTYAVVQMKALFNTFLFTLVMASLAGLHWILAYWIFLENRALKNSKAKYRVVTELYLGIKKIPVKHSSIDIIWMAMPIFRAMVFTVGFIAYAYKLFT